MSDVLQKMETRRSIRKFKGDMVPQDIMDKFIKYGIDDPYIWRHN